MLSSMPRLRFFWLWVSLAEMKKARCSTSASRARSTPFMFGASAQ